LHCHTPLTALQLIPILSFLIQKGRCKSCHFKISPLYLLAEITGALLLTSPLIFLSNPPTNLIQTWILFSLLITVTLTDLYYRRIPNKILIAFGIPLLLMRPNIATSIIGFLFFYGTALLLKILFKKNTIGGGDIKLYLVIGLVLSTQSLFLSITISSATALIYLFISKNNKNKPIPFAPCSAFGTIIAYILSMH
jgi:leader peptidase (prepilin peptidase)/N-methyltransferase